MNGENLSLRVNGQAVSLPSLPGETLASLLRDRLQIDRNKDRMRGIRMRNVHGPGRWGARTFVHVSSRPRDW